MDTLRWILLLLGIAILLGIYLSGRLNKPRRPRMLDDEDLDAEGLNHIHIRADDPSAAPDIQVPTSLRADPLERIVPSEPPVSPAPAATGGQGPERSPRRVQQGDGAVGRETADTQTARVELIRIQEDETQASEPADGENRKPAWSWLKVPGRSAPARRSGAPDAEPEASQGSSSVRQQDIPEKIIILHVAAPAHQSFLGVQLETALREQGLEFGEMSIYHYHIQLDSRPATLFSVANMVKPGTFEPSQMKTFSSPGLTLFLRLPGPMDPLESFEAMLSCADRLAQRLGGQVLDASRSAMTRQCREHAREEIGRWRLRAGLGGR